MRLPLTIDSNQGHEVDRVNWLRAKARFDRWEEEVKLVTNEMRWTGLWFDYQHNVWAGRAEGSSQQGLKGHSCYAWKQAGMWEKLARDGREIFSKALIVS